MKVYISADIEGICGVTHWDETNLDKSVWAAAREQMTAEVVAACAGALDAGAREVLVKDAHAEARNIIPEKLPRQARLIRGWSGHPFLMMSELDKSFNACMMIGYHSAAGTGANPLAHTMNGGIVALKINGALSAEFHVNALTAAYCKVPVVLVSGDQGLCEAASAFHPPIHTVAVKQGTGDSTNSMHPQSAVDATRAAAAEAVADAAICRLALPEQFLVELQYRRHQSAYQAGFYPGAQQTGPTTVSYETKDYFEVLRFLSFVM